MAAVDHDPRFHTCLGQVVVDLGDTLPVVVRASVAATQHQMGIRIAGGVDHRRVPLRIDTEVAMSMRRTAHGIACHADTAVGAVLEAHRDAQAAGQFAMDLRFGGTRADCDPAQQVIEVARCHWLQHFAGQRQAQGQHFAHQVAAQGQAARHVVGAVQVRIVRQAFPAHRGAWLFHVGAHHQQHFALELMGQLAQVAGVLERGLRIVQGAGADHHQQAWVTAFENGADGKTVVLHLGCKWVRYGQLLLEREVTGQTMGCRCIGSVLHRMGLDEGGARQSGQAVVHDQGPGQRRGGCPLALSCQGVRQSAGESGLRVMPPMNDRSEAAGWPERRLLNRQKSQVSKR